MELPRLIETKRLRLRPPIMEDANEIFRKYAQDVEVTKYVMWSPHENIEITKQFLRRCVQALDAGQSSPWVIEMRESNELMGMIELRVKDHCANIGYTIARQYRGQGYMTEVVGTLVEWALSQPDIYRIWAVCDVDNIASARVLEKAGMEKEGVLRRYLVHPNLSDEPRDCYCYSAIK
ncbi:MAG: GNAT family N-acetyltransferase [Chloroflexi bacterium]|nr:GNAT family N-acetyltransferase [Chloroflexota bacterium]